MKKLVMLGAGNIGRSFIAQLFSQAGYETVFIDINQRVIDALNKYHTYNVEIRDIHPKTIVVRNVRGVSAKDTKASSFEIATADIIATAVGPNNLSSIYPLIAEGILRRSKSFPLKPIDIIICENLRNASDIFRKELKSLLPAKFGESDFPGLVETSIGKMVPLLTHDAQKKDVLTVYAEAYNTLILDAKGFRGEIPDVPGLEPKGTMKAYVDRKLFIHNLGHSMTAYLGYLTNPSFRYIWEAIGRSEIRDIVKAGMGEARDALIAEYPDEFNEANLDDHIEDLLSRFANKALGDTIYRVGRDLSRKLASEERLAGALGLERKHNLPHTHTLLGIAAALHFCALDEEKKPFPGDTEIRENVNNFGIHHVLQSVSGLIPDRDKDIMSRIESMYGILTEFKNSPHINLTGLLASI